jgi:hypothetical protein
LFLRRQFLIGRKQMHEAWRALTHVLDGYLWAEQLPEADVVVSTIMMINTTK